MYIDLSMVCLVSWGKFDALSLQRPGVTLQAYATSDGCLGYRASIVTAAMPLSISRLSSTEEGDGRFANKDPRVSEGLC